MTAPGPPSNDAEAPRLFGLVAGEAPVVAIIRRGPSKWTQVSALHVDENRWQAGSWIKATLTPQSCGVSPNARWFAYHATNYNSGGRWTPGPTYVAISRLPWLTALAAWESTPSSKCQIVFVDQPGRNDLGRPDAGDVAPYLRRGGLTTPRIPLFNVERRNGWTETADTPPLPAKPSWDTRTNVRMGKPQPNAFSGPDLEVGGRYASTRGGKIQYGRPAYRLRWTDHGVDLADLQWADWAHDGRLVGATFDGRLQIRELHGRQTHVVFENDLSTHTPEPQPPPEEARHW